MAASLVLVILCIIELLTFLFVVILSVFSCWQAAFCFIKQAFVPVNHLFVPAVHVLRGITFPLIIGVFCFLLSSSGAWAVTAADAAVANTFAFSCLSASEPVIQSAWNSTAPHALFGSMLVAMVMQNDTTRTSDTVSSSEGSSEGTGLLAPTDSARTRAAGGGARNRIGRFGVPLPKGYEYSATVDSSGSEVRLRETYGNSDFSLPQTLTLDEYIAQRKVYLQRKTWDSLTKQYDLQKALDGDDISGLLSRATNLSIPIPDNPLMGIFGKPEISINVNGEVNVRGGWRWDSQNLGTASAFGQTQSGPIFSQDIQVNVSGRIGDKLKLGVNWNTKEQFEFNNTFKIGYDGYDDDIIRKVEAGNVQLQTPATLIGGSQALFGVRADFQFGPVFLKTIASQKRGQRRFVSLEGGSLRQPFGLRAYDYAENHFFLDTAYKQIYSEYYKPYPPTNPPPNRPPIGDLSQRLTVKDLEVWVSTTEPKEQAVAKQGVAYDTLSPVAINGTYPLAMSLPATTKPGEIVQGRFVKLEERQYEFDPILGTVTILNLNKSKTYAVAYRIENGTGSGNSDDLVYGTFAKNASDSSTLILKLVYSPGFNPSFRMLWSRQLKNIYQIGPTNVNISETDINVWYLSPKNDSTDVLPGSGQKLVSLLRVDQVANGSNQPPADGVFDVQTGFFFNPIRGEITFPSLEPFAGGLVEVSPANAEYAFRAVYDTTKEVARQQTQFDRFVISGQASGTAGNRIALPSGFNLAPGSVRVTLNGRQLQEGRDYTVEYYSGQVTLVSPEASLPGANVNVEYEQNDIFNLSTRTLVGARADFDWKTILRSRDIKLNFGSTFMSYDQSLIIDRVRIGDEPVSNTMFGFDGTLNWDAKWLTKLADALPFYDTKEASAIDVRGEWAMMLPDPNKKRSDIPSDNGASVAYVDDFEGAQLYIPLGLQSTQWTYASAPNDSTIAPDDTLRSLYRGRMYWWRYFIGRTPAREVYPNKNTLQGQSNISELLVNFEPQYRGIYNANPNYIDSSDFTRDSLDRLWGGMMRLLSSFNTNFDAQNIDYIEVMMKLEEGTEYGKARMFVDLGQISEDVIPDRKTSTEDGITQANPIANGIVDDGEDIGIDAKNNEAEKNSYPPPLNGEDDPARDDFFFDFTKPAETQQPSDFVRYNNYEGNSGSTTGQFPDTEVLNRNNGNEITRNDSYFTYEVKLDPNPATNPQIVGSNSGWNLYRIPIRGPRREFGNPSFSNVQYVRVWFKGGRVFARIADWRLAGAYWQRFGTLPNGQTDTTLNVAFVNREENNGAPDYYNLPPGVNPPRQQSGTNNEVILLNEQSIAISVKDLRYGDERTAVRFFRPFDMFYYKELKFFVHGDGSMPDRVVDRSAAPAIAYIRFGTDSLNYYEYNRPLVRGWQDLGVILEQLTAIKQLRAPDGYLQRIEFEVPGDPLAKFAVKGNPSLTRIQFVGLGIANPTERFPNSLTTTMWVDELRLIGAENSKDWAGVFSTQVKVADLGNLNFNFNRTNPNFHRLEERFGNRIQTTNWSVSANASLDKFFSKEWYGTSIPITYTHSETVQDPLFVAQSDVNVEEAAAAAKRQALERGATEEQARQDSVSERTRSQTIMVQDQWAVTGLRIGLPSKQWYIRDTFNKLTFGFNYNQTFERSPVVAERFHWEWRFTGNYAVTIPPDYTVQPLSWLAGIPVLESYKDYKLSLTPGNFSSSLSLNRGRTTEQSRYLDVPSPVVRIFAAERQAQFSWKIAENGLLNPTLDYSLSATSTLIPLELDNNQRQRNSGDVFSSIFFNNGKLVNLGDDSRFTQTFTLNFKPKLPAVAGIDKYFDATGTFSTNYTWQDQLSKDPVYADINKTAQWDNTIRFGLGVSLKTMSDAWYGRSAALRGPKNPTATDSSTSEGGVVQGFLDVFKFVFLDYDKVTINFNQSNNSSNPGILGGTGVTNFWARAPFGRAQDNIYGPVAAYQLGLIGSPHGGFNIRGASAFPFFRFETYPGVRAANASLFDNFAQQSSLDMRTSRPLWPGATLELNWRSQFKYNKNQKILTDANGIPSFSSIVVEQGYNRTFISLPDFLLLGAFDNTVEHVVNLYRERRTEIVNNTPNDTVRQNQQLLDALADSFEEGLEAFNFFPGALRQIMPRVNWALRWNGLEKWSFFDGLARSISLEHRYNSTYQKNVKITDEGRAVESQQVDLSFEPLIGVSMQFDEKKLDGNLTGNIRYNTKTGYRLNSSARATISRDVTQELSIQASYNKRGFEFPLFGLSLQNDVEFSFQGTYRRTKRATFDVNNFDDEAGRTLDGSTQIIIEPRARYSISRQVTATGFFRYEANLTEGAANPGNSTTQVGIDLRISISGGR